MNMNFKEWCKCNCPIILEARKKPKGKRRKTGKWKRPAVLPLITLAPAKPKQPKPLPVSKPVAIPQKILKYSPTAKIIAKKLPTPLGELVGSNRLTLKDVEPMDNNNSYGSGVQNTFKKR
jgi:hypothetical protein